MHKKIIILIVIILIFSLSGCSNFTSDTHTFGSNPINNTHMGFIVKDTDGAIYYQDGDNSNAITKIKEWNKESYNDTNGININLYNGYIYYRSDFDEGAKLIRIRLDDPSEKEII